MDSTAWQQSIADVLGHWRRDLPDLAYKGPHRHPICPANNIGELMPWAYQAMVEEQKSELEAKSSA